MALQLDTKDRQQIGQSQNDRRFRALNLNNILEDVEWKSSEKNETDSMNFKK
jgi:hypothetical protein